MNKRFKSFKTSWEITRNWQILYPFVGVLSAFYLGFILATKIVDYPYWFRLGLAFVFGFFFVQLCVFCIRKLETKWKVESRWELIRIFIVFAITGSSSVYVGRPIIKLLGVSKDNLSPVLYGIIFTVVSLIFYQILLVFWGFVLGQFEFFWNFEKKMLRRMGLGRFLSK